MKTTLTLIVLMVFLSETTFAQRAMPSGGFSIAASAGMRAYDAEIGVEIGTPSVFKRHVCLRIKGNVAWLESYKAAYDNWERYRSVTVMMVYSTNMLGRARVYVELGPYLIYPDQAYSTSNCVQGLAGAVGAELFLSAKSRRASYFFSGGLAYADAIADKLEGQPGYGSGFVFSNGLRFYF